jgi:hypothetical protein
MRLLARPFPAFEAGTEAQVKGADAFEAIAARVQRILGR